MSSLFLIIKLCALLTLGGQPVQWPNIPSPVITSFHYSYGAFDGGIQYYTITRTEQGAVLNAVGLHGAELYVPPDHPVPPDVLDDLMQILQESGATRWNGFTQSHPNVEDGYSFSLRVEAENAPSLLASGYEMYPAGYWESHAPLAAYLEALAYAYRTEPEWGIPTYFSFIYYRDKEDFDTFRLTLNSDNTVQYRHISPSCTKEGELSPWVMADLQQMLEENEISDWFGYTNKGDTVSFPSFSMRIFYDNDTSLYAYGRVDLPHNFAEKAAICINYLNELETHISPIP